MYEIRTEASVEYFKVRDHFYIDNTKVVLRHVKWAELTQESSSEGFCGYCNGASDSISAE
jgi:hypothetical protein